MIEPVTTRLSEGHRWLRVADEAWDEVWDDPLDPAFAHRHGGRWNPPNSYATLYLNENLDTARAQIHKMLEGSPVRPEDIDQGYALIAATLPSRQDVADAVTDTGLAALGLPDAYPQSKSGSVVPHETCQTIGADIKTLGLRGVHARSVATQDGSGRELAWFPARRSSRATPVGDPVPFGAWWYDNALFEPLFNPSPGVAKRSVASAEKPQNVSHD